MDHQEIFLSNRFKVRTLPRRSCCKTQWIYKCQAHSDFALCIFKNDFDNKPRPYRKVGMSLFRHSRLYHTLDWPSTVLELKPETLRSDRVSMKLCKFEYACYWHLMIPGWYQTQFLIFYLSFLKLAPSPYASTQWFLADSICSCSLAQSSGLNYFCEFVSHMSNFYW